MPLTPPHSAGPLLLPLDRIDEDPHQPRRADNPGFSKESLRELAATIATRGVKTPISVRERPDANGRFMINHGARRFRASKIAGQTNIPAFVDNDFIEVDQIIENLQRNDLTPREIADFIGRELAKGKQKKTIAHEMGKSPAYVSQHIALLDLPDPVATAFNNGRVTDLTVISELVKAYKKDPATVATWLEDDDQEITRTAVKLLRDFLEDKHQRAPFEVEVEAEAEEGIADRVETLPDEDDPPASTLAPPSTLKRPILEVEYHHRAARLLLNRRPTAKGLAWLHYEDNGEDCEVELGAVRLVALWGPDQPD